MKEVLFLLISLTSIAATANDILSGWSFYAPSISNEQDGNTVLEAGDIVFDTGESKLFGYSFSRNIKLD